MKRQTTIVGLDIGSHSIKACCGLAGDDKLKEIAGVFEVPAKGMREGNIFELSSMISSIQSCLRIIEEKIALPVDLTYASLNGLDIVRSDHSAFIDLKDNDGQIARGDVNRINSLARDIALSYEKQLIHVLPIDYEVDGARGIANPLGMYGSRLGMHVNVVSANRNHTQNLAQAVQSAGLEIDELRLGLLACSEVVLSAQDRHNGVILIDMGAEVVQAGFFKNGFLCDFTAFGLGGNTITNAISDHFQISSDVAETLKIRYGGCISKTKYADENLVVKTHTGYKYYSRQKLCELVDARTREIMNTIASHIVQKRYYRQAASGVVVVGGGCLLEGLLEIAQELINLECRMGFYHQGFKSQIRMDVVDIKYATSVGLVQYGFTLLKGKKPRRQGRLGQLIGTVRDFYQDYF